MERPITLVWVTDQHTLGEIDSRPDRRMPTGGGMLASSMSMTNSGLLSYWQISVAESPFT